MSKSSYARLLLFMVFYFVSFVSALAQNSFVQGYVLPVAGKDTVKCMIEVRDAYWNLSVLRTKKDANSAIMDMQLSQIASFQIMSGHQELYLVREVDIDMKPVDVNNLEENITKRIEKRRVPLKVLVNSKVSLLTFLDENRKRHFFYKKEEAINELNYVKYFRPGVVGSAAEFEEYKQQLKNLFSDCPGMTFKGTFSEVDLVKAFQRYNQCLGSSVSVAKKEKNKLSLNLIAGVASYSLAYDGADNYSANGASAADYKSAFGTTAGLSLDFLSAERPKKMIVGLELLLNKTSTITGVDASTTNPSTYNFDFTMIDLNITTKYSFGRGEFFNPYLKGGAGLNYLLQNNSTARIPDIIGSWGVVSNLTTLKKIGPVLLVGLGCQIKRFTIEVRYQFNEFGATEMPTVVKLSSIGTMLSYRLTK